MVMPCAPFCRWGLGANSLILRVFLWGQVKMGASQNEGIMRGASPRALIANRAVDVSLQDLAHCLPLLTMLGA